MTYAIQRDSLIRTRQEIITVGVRECQNFYATLVQQYLERTEEIDHAEWTKVAVTVSANDAEAPDGTMTADTVTYDAANDEIYQNTLVVAPGSKAFTGSVWMRVPAGSETITIWIYNTGAAQFGAKQVTLTTTWTRFWVHKKFAAAGGFLFFGIIRTAVDDATDVEIWGANLYQNPGDLDQEMYFPYTKRVAEVVGTIAVNVSRCEAPDQGDGYRCYYSRPSCQNPDNFNSGHTYEGTANLQGLREFQFCYKLGPPPVPGADIAPLLISLQSAPQEIDAERAITVNERMTFRFEDDDSPGLWNVRQSGLGAYVNTAIGGGTFWRRWASIYRNYSNPEGYLVRKVGFVEAGGTEDDYQTRGKYLIQNFKTSDRQIFLTCSDRLKLTRKKIPAKISDFNLVTNKLTSGATTITVKDASEITPPAPNAASASPDYYVTLELDPEGTCERVNVTAIDLDTNQLTVQRGRWGTNAAAHNRNISFRQVYQFGTEFSTPSGTVLGKNPIDILIELYRYAGLSSDEIDTTTLQAERDMWLPSSVNITTAAQYGCLFRRLLTDISEVEILAREVRELCMIFLWVSDAQILTGKIFAPPGPTDTQTTLTDDANLLAGSIETDHNQATRISRALVTWNLNAGEEGDSVEDYGEVRVDIDADAEDRDYYGEERLKIVMTKWLEVVADSRTPEYYTSHLISRFRHGARLLRARLELKDEDLDLGSVIVIETDHVQDFQGNADPLQMYIVKKEPANDNQIKIEALDTGGFERTCFLCPDGLADYDAATDAERRYGYLSDDNGLVGTPKVKAYHLW